MKRIKTYIVNLATATVRKNYMEHLLASYNFLDVEFVEAIDGRKLTETERRRVFDDDQCLKMIGRYLNGGEVGCTLSHRKCYETLLASQEHYAMIFEDDISVIRDLNELSNYDIDKIMSAGAPTVLMLSGDYWYWRKREIVSVYDCIGAYAYIINRNAAQLILSHKASSVADNWKYYISNGLKIKAICPYMVDANLNMDALSSDIAQNEWIIHRNKMDFNFIFKSYSRAIVQRILKCLGHFESKIRVIGNRIVEE